MEVSKYNQMMSYLTRPKNKLKPIAFESGDRTTAGVRYTAAEAKKLIKEFESFPGLFLQKKRDSYYVTYRRVKDGKKLAEYVDLPATEDNIEKLKKVHEVVQQKNFPKILNDADFERLRLLDENINLTNKEFAEKLVNVYDKTTFRGQKWSPTIVRNKQIELKIQDKVKPELVEGGPGKGRSINEAKSIIREFNKADLDALNLIKDPKERKKAIRKKANSIVSAENFTRSKGSMHGVQNSSAGDLWKNFYESTKKNDRIKISGTFNGKDLRFSKNFPRNKDGKVNWFIKDKNGIPAWKLIEFTDTATPKGSVTYKWDLGERTGNLKAQVDNAFGAGHFARSTSAYQRQRELFKTPFTLDGVEGTNFGKIVARNTIINKYKAATNGKMPNERYIANNMPRYSPSQVHHFRGGIGNDPYSTQLVSRIANQKLGAAESRYSKDIALAKGDAEKIKAADNALIGQIDEISNKYGGIKYELRGKKFGSAASTKSIMETAVKGIGADDQTTKKLLATISTLPQCQGKFSEGGSPQSLDACARDGARVINENKINDLSPAQRRNAATFLNRAYKLGRGILKFGVIPEAIFVTGESLVRMGMGDTFNEAFLRATDYLRPGDQTKEADRLKFERTLDKETADIIMRARDYKDSINQLNTAKSNLETNQAVLDQSDFGYTGNVDALKQQELDEQIIKSKEQNVKDKYVPEAVRSFATVKEAEAQDIASSNSAFAKAIQNAKSAQTDDFEQIFALPEKEKGVAAPMLTMDDIADIAVTDTQLQRAKDELGGAPEYTKRNILDFNRQTNKEYNDAVLGLIFAEGEKNLANRERLFGTQSLFGGQPITGGVSTPTNRFADFKLGMAGGGIAKLAGIDKGPQITSMNPDSGGLASLQKNVKKL
jgi:hypothetical protein